MSLRTAAVATGSILGALALALTGPAAAHSGAGAPGPGPSGAHTPRAAAQAPVTVAHRGASGYAPENTLAAADRAAALDIDWVETDVQRTRDGVLVLMHDESLERTTNARRLFPDRAPWRVADFTSKEVARLDAGSWFGSDFAGERVPTLGRFLDRLTRNGQKLLLELKNPGLYPGIEREVLGELGDRGWLDRSGLRSRLVVQSFDADSVRTVHQQEPAVKTGFLGSPDTSELASYTAFADQINPRWTALTAEYVSAVQSLRGPHGTPMEVYTWTVDDAATAVRTAALGVDGIISNRPDVVRDATGTPRTATSAPGRADAPATGLPRTPAGEAVPAARR